MPKLPHKFIPRDYQVPVLKALDSGYKRAVCVWHRRSGKDKTFLNYTIKEMFKRKGVYYYFTPTYAQGKKTVWMQIGKDGFKFLDHFPPELVKRKNDTEMLVETTNGSIFQVIGTDNYDSIRGTNPVGCVFSEYSYQDPNAWSIIRPILAENDGWAVFNYTPQGDNHGRDLFDMAKKEKSWYCEKLTVDDTKVIPEHVLEQERKEIMYQYGDDAFYQQEYECNFDIPIQGAYYGPQLNLAIKENRMTKVPWETGISVDTWWDLGIDDSMSIWFSQTIGREIRFIDYIEGSGEGLDHYAKLLKSKPYVYGRHVAPHDIEVREIGTGKSRRETAARFGINFEVAPKLSIEDGINACRMIFSRLYFDEGKCERGLKALKNYTKEWDDKTKKYKNRPLHNWASHAADAFRTFGVSYKDMAERYFKKDFKDKWQLA